ncbi:MAG: glycerophosphodiester phosphodiesterase [Cellulosilyticaceae bacterium]
MIVFAHRGASGDYPENTLLAFKKAIELGVTGIELDVHKTKDNEIVVIHDEDMERTFNGQGLIAHHTLEELRRFNARKLEFTEREECGICTLKEVLDLIVSEPKICLNIELKTDQIEYEGIEADVITLVQSYHMADRIILSSFNHNSLRRCKAIDTSIKLGALYHYQIDEVVKYALELGVDAIHPNVELVTRELIEACHVNNIRVNTYTVNSPQIMRQLIAAGIDGIFTDYPGLLLEVLKIK